MDLTAANQVTLKLTKVNMLWLDSLWVRDGPGNLGKSNSVEHTKENQI